MNQTLLGKVAVISGSCSGIGAAIARELSLRGARIAINYPFPHLRSQAEGLADSLPTESTAIEADISTTDGPDKLIREAVQRFTKIDVLINNAALAINLPLEEQSLVHWDNLVSLNCRGTFLLTKAVLPHLTKSESRIVNIDSVSARAAPPMQTIYAGTKGMVDCFTRVWAKELPRKYGCTVNAVSPGPTATEGFADAGDTFMEAMKPIMAQTPVASRMAQPEEIAFAVAFLCEPRASWVNGLHMIVSGGLHID